MLDDALERPSDLANAFSLSMAEVGSGRMVKWFLTMTFPVARLSNFTVPVRLPVGKRTIQSSVRWRMLFDISGTADCI